MWDFLDVVGPSWDDDVNQGMHLNIHLKSQLEDFLSVKGQASMEDGNIQYNPKTQFGLEAW